MIRRSWSWLSGLLGDWRDEGRQIMSVKIRMTYTEVEEMAGVIRLLSTKGELETIAEQNAEQREMSANAEVGGV